MRRATSYSKPLVKSMPPFSNQGGTGLSVATVSTPFVRVKNAGSLVGASVVVVVVVVGKVVGNDVVVAWPLAPADPAQAARSSASAVPIATTRRWRTISAPPPARR